MEQLVMKATAPYKSMTRALPTGYKFSLFSENEKDIEDWKNIFLSEPRPADGVDSCYHLMIEIYPDLNKETDVHFIENSSGERVATITTITHADGVGYIHMVRAKDCERGKGLGHIMAEYALQIFKERGVNEVVLTTDDFRLPAIKTYLDAGFLPIVDNDEQSEINNRWNNVLKKLNYTSVNRIVKG